MFAYFKDKDGKLIKCSVDEHYNHSKQHHESIQKIANESGAKTAVLVVVK